MLNGDNVTTGEVICKSMEIKIGDEQEVFGVTGEPWISCWSMPSSAAHPG
jgi:hypothetical protein